MASIVWFDWSVPKRTGTRIVSEEAARVRATQRVARTDLRLHPWRRTSDGSAGSDTARRRSTRRHASHLRRRPVLRLLAHGSVASLEGLVHLAASCSVASASHFL